VIVDVNVNLSRWPFRRTACDELPKLLERLARHDVAEAWVGSLDGLFHRDIGGVNARLAADCAAAGGVRLVPFGSVNPMLPDWQEDLRRCHEDHRMPGIRLHPNYHGYQLDDPVLSELLGRAEARGLIVQLAVRMDDDRVQHPLMPVADVDVKLLPELVTRHPKLPLVLLNAVRSLAPTEAASLAASGNVSFEISMLEGVGGIATLIETVPIERMLFGSHLPLFHLESAMLKLRESALSEEQLAALTYENARRMLEGGGRPS
jgi:predicted TIM-barrel fold metal-dependent hydrolase